ncbi:hypothetical protein PVK06_019164 [Gossypium arboreum]|uniref:Uncharacterized protein n=1 Tax=Gossypium arboreum TaxID=29729 RepID=A0ABR0PIW7_GOSAR|nr:hypothetical protein PVK06_019164 [Gossypium arboreum]
MSERISTVIYYDCEVYNTENGIFYQRTQREWFLTRVKILQNFVKELGAKSSKQSQVRRDDVLSMTSTGKGTSYIANNGGLDNEFDVDPPQEPSPGGAEVALFSKLKPVSFEPKDIERGSVEEKEDS